VFVRKLLLLLVAASGTTDGYAQASGQAPEAERHAYAIEILRRGEHEAATEILRELYEQNPQYETYLYDYIVALSWSQNDAAALALEPQLDPEKTPLYVVDAVAKSARNAQARGTAVKWYLRAISIEPQNIEFRIGLALTHAEGGEYGEADAVFTALPREQRTTAGVLAAQAYIQRLAGQHVAALHAYEQLLEEYPDDPELLRGKALVLRDLLLPRQALALAETHPGILTPAEVQRLQVDALAIQLRLAADTIYPEELDGILLDETIEEIDTHLRSASESDALLALRFDRIAALAERNESQAAIDAFLDLDLPNTAIPPYVLAAAGKSYLQLEQPQRAAELLELAMAAPPIDIETELSLIYAYLDMDRYEDAATLKDATLAKYPMLLRSPDSTVVKGNEDRIRAEVVAAITESSIDRHEMAQQRLELLLADSPNNSDVRHELANIYRWRGWLDRSLYEYDQVLTMNDSLVYARAGRANTLLEAQNYRAVEATVEALESRPNPDPVVTQLAKRWTVHNRSQLVIAASGGESSGFTFGNRQRTVDAWWYTQPIRYNYRPFVHLHDAFSEFPEGDASRKRTGLGTEYRNGPWTARGELIFDREFSELGLAGDVDWRFSDRWQLSAQLAKNGSDTHLRGYRVAVESDTIAMAATLAMNESLRYSFGNRMTSFSDGNRLQALYANMYRRVLTRPRSLTHVTAEIYTGRNSRQDVNYYAPERDLTTMVGLEHDWRIRRRYDRMLLQRTAFQIGNYNQKGFGSGTLWRARYAIDLSLSETLNMELGVQRARNLYNGAPEYSTFYLITLQARL
jgi:biofilm PGA synthesis protein PgaA